MAKKVYSIPYDINKTQLDRQFQLQSAKHGIKFTKKPITMLTLLFWVAAIVVLSYILMKTFVGSGSIVGAIFFSIGFLGFMYVMSRQDETQRYGYALLGTYIEYVMKKTREMKLVRSTPLDRAKKFFGVDYIVEDGVEDGLITMVDGRFARIYTVTGSASAMMFDADQDRVIDANERFYKNLPETVDVIVDTISEPQTVDDQVEFAMLRKELVVNDVLKQLYDEQAYMLKVSVNGYKDPNAKIIEGVNDSEQEGFKSIRQYMMIIGDDKQGLYEAENAMMDDMDRSGYVFRYSRPLNHQEIEAYYAGLFK